MKAIRPEWVADPSFEELRTIRTKPGQTSDGKPFNWYVKTKEESGEWRLECVRADVLGLATMPRSTSSRIMISKMAIRPR